MFCCMWVSIFHHPERTAADVACVAPAVRRGCRTDRVSALGMAGSTRDATGLQGGRACVGNVRGAVNAAAGVGTEPPVEFALGVLQWPLGHAGTVDQSYLGTCTRFARYAGLGGVIFVREG